MEGFQLQVLKGATEVLARTDCVLLDCWSEHTKGFGYTPKGFIALMQSASFYGYRLSGAVDEISLMPLGGLQRTGPLENCVFVSYPAWLRRRCTNSAGVE